MNSCEINYCTLGKEEWDMIKITIPVALFMEVAAAVWGGFWMCIASGLVIGTLFFAAWLYIWLDNLVGAAQ